MQSSHVSKRLVPLALLSLVLSISVLSQEASRASTGKEQSSTSYLYSPASAEGLGSRSENHRIPEVAG